MSNKILYKLSVIIPVYNIEEYIERCVESVLAQDYPNFEVILVDDGSQDNSGRLCDLLSKKYSSVRVIHKPNGGQSEARNIGIEHARGDYIIFIDGDDFIDQYMFSDLMKFCNTNKYDLVGCHHKDDYDGKIINSNRQVIDFDSNGIEALRLLLEGKLIPGTACAKVIKKSLLSNIRFPVGKTYEDVYFTTEILLNVQSAHFTTKAYYHYWHRSNSTTTEEYSKKSWDIIDAYKFSYDRIMEIAPQLKTQILFRLYWAHFVVLDRMLMSEDESELEKRNFLVKYLKRNFGNIIKCDYFSRGRKILAMALMINLTFYNLLLSRGLKKRAVNK